MMLDLASGVFGVLVLPRAMEHNKEVVNVLTIATETVWKSNNVEQFSVPVSVFLIGT